MQLIDQFDNRAVFDFATSAFTTVAMSTVVLEAPTFQTGPVNVSQIVRFEVSGDFTDSSASFSASIDRIAAVDPVQPVPEPSLALLVGLVALVGRAFVDAGEK